MTTRPSLPEPITISKFWKTRRRDEVIIVELREYNERPLIDVRVHVVDAEGKLRPSAKGIAMSVRRLVELAAAINKALDKARALGLIDDASDLPAKRRRQ